MKKSELFYYCYKLLSSLSLDIFRILIFWWVISEYGGEELSSLLFIITLASFILIPLLGPISDFYIKSRILSYSHLAYAACFFFIFLNISSEASVDTKFIIFGCIYFIIAVITSISSPASNAIMAEIAESERLPLVIRKTKSILSSLALINPLLASALGLISIELGLIVSGSIALMVALVAFKMKSSEPISSHNQEIGLRVWSKSIIQGWKLKFQIKIELWYTIIVGFTNLLITPFFLVLIPLFIKERFSADIFAYGAAESAIAIGILLAALLVLPYLNKKLHKSWICSIGVFISGTGVILASMSENLWLFIGILPFTGLGIAVFTMNGMSHRLLAFPKTDRSKISAVDLSIGNITKALGLGVTGYFIGFYDIQIIALTYATLILIMSFVIMLIPDWKEFMSLRHDQLEGYFERKYSITT
ncbi:MFS transporter [Endozoicomonas acroporae]|uniref:MFS transporter n=1 Tax=Endozoicomonas acroporae TaxID=1701104 RepID=UPI003D7B537C